MIDKEFYWRDFLEEVNNQLKKYLASLHFAYERRNDAIFNIKDNENKYIEAGINISNIYDFDNTNKIYYNKHQEFKIGVKLASYINSYNYLVYDRIPELDAKIDTFSKIKNIPSAMYRYLQDEINYNIENQIVKGNNYSFGSKIGTVYPYVYKFPKGSICRYVNWKESKELKKLLEDKGITLISPENPNGAKWKVIADYSFCVKACYNKHKNRILESNYYTFKFAYTPGVGYRDKPRPAIRPSDLKNKTFEEILEDKTMPTFNKILGIVVNIPELRYSLYKNNVNTKSNKL